MVMLRVVPAGAVDSGFDAADYLGFGQQSQCVVDCGARKRGVVRLQGLEYLVDCGMYPVFHQKSEDGHPLRGWFYASFREGVQDFLSGETIGLHRINGTLGLDVLLSCNNYNFNFDTKLYHLLLLCK